jgi:RNA polymerase sigma-70 factor (ECF subfamily)
MDSRGSLTSPTLLGRLAREPFDQAAWDEFVDRYAGRIYAWCRRWRLPAADAEDVTQEVLVRLVRAMRTFTYDPGRSFRCWLKTVTQHAWSDYRDARPADAPAGLLDTVEARADLLERLREEFDQELLHQAMERVRWRVEPRTWEAFRLMRVEGLAGADVARRLGMQAATVFVVVGRVQKKIRDEVRLLEQGPQQPS